jgi:DNA-binding NarL/FixJ family response regulator
MFDSDFHVLFLGEDLAWSALSRAIAAAPRIPLKIHRAQSLNELLLVLAGGSWHAVVLDVHAWNFQGLHYVDKLRSEYPAFPILALYSPSVEDLDNKARNIGASRCLSIDDLAAEAVHSAVVSCLSDHKSNSHLRKAAPMNLTFNIPENSSVAASKTQVISHALNNLLCVITANADILSDQLKDSAHGERSLSEIKRAAKSAADLTRLLK